MLYFQRFLRQDLLLQTLTRINCKAFNAFLPMFATTEVYITFK